MNFLRVSGSGFFFVELSEFSVPVVRSIEVGATSTGLCVCCVLLVRNRSRTIMREKAGATVRNSKRTFSLDFSWPRIRLDPLFRNCSAHDHLSEKMNGPH